MADSKVTALTELSAAPDDADLLLVVDDPAGTPVSKKVTVANLRAAMALPMIHVREEKSAGTDGGTFTSGAWRTRALSSVVKNTISGASLASSQITLPAGTYKVRAWATGYRVERHKVRVYNDTDSAIVADMEGSSEHTRTGSTEGATGGKSEVRGEFTLAAEKDIELQHQCSATKADNGLGVASNFGIAEVYSEVYIEKIA